MTESPATHAICISCGYDLAGLSKSALCPECATPCSMSMSPHVIYRAGPAYIRRLFIGSQLAYWSVLAFFVFLFVPIPVMIAAALGLGIFGIGAAYLLPLMLWAAGWQLATPPDPSHFTGGERDAPRRALRALVWLCTLNVPLVFITPGSPWLAGVLFLTLFLVCFGAFFTTAAYIRRIAIRAGDEEARKAAASARNLGAWAFVAIMLGLVTMLTIRALISVSLIHEHQGSFFESVGTAVAAVGLLMLAAAFDRAARHFGRMMRTVHQRAREIAAEHAP